MKLAASVVLFNPDKSVISNILSYSEFVDFVFAIDNSECINNVVIAELRDIRNLTYVKNERNLGIAKALNQACIMAFEQGYDWILTMDQDSSFDLKEIQRYREQFIQFANSDKRIGLICPAEKNATSFFSLTEPAFRITSGTWVNLSAFKSVNGFDEMLFIDEVDYDFSFKMYLAGYRLVGFDNIEMKHQLGIKRKVGFLKIFFKKERTIHNPFRLYYMVRNYLLIRKRYSSFFPELFKKRDIYFRVMLKNNLFFSSDFFQAMKMAIKGYRDYKKIPIK